MADSNPKRILYCRCAYAQVLPPGVKNEVLRGLGNASIPFEAVSDLCEMAARNDPRLRKIADQGEVRIAACYPRAVKWLFHSADADLPEEGVEFVNMREETANGALEKLLTDTY